MVSEFVYRDHSRNDAYALYSYTAYRHAYFMVSEFVYRDHSRNDAYALHSYTRVSCVDATSKILECLLEKFPMS